MKQITIRVNTDQQVEQLRDVLADFDFVVGMGPFLDKKMRKS